MILNYTYHLGNNVIRYHSTTLDILESDLARFNKLNRNQQIAAIAAVHKRLVANVDITVIDFQLQSLN